MHREHLIRLLRERSLKRAPEGEFFTLASGKKSKTYLDVRLTALSAEGHMLLGQMLYGAVQRLSSVEAVAGVELGGCPLASATAMFSAFVGSYGGPRPLSALYVRKQAKDHGSKNLVEGTKEPGLQIALLEDVVTTGGSSLRALQTLHNEGFAVKGVIAVVDREEGGAEVFAKVNVPFVALTTLKEILGE
jgi:orotate phosphoribosyltransferase